MLLSVVVYNHKLTAGQWIGTGIVFVGISVEAWVKRTGEGDPLDICHPCAAEGLLISFRDPRKTCCTGEGEGKDQGIIKYWTSGSSLGRSSMDFVIPIVIHSLPSHRNTSAIWIPRVCICNRRRLQLVASWLALVPETE
jgi:hypothetical protein